MKRVERLPNQRLSLLRFDSRQLLKLTWVTAILIADAVTATTCACAENWPNWRGPRHTSVSGERGIPLVWNKNQGVLWKSPLSGKGNSTPAVWDFLTFLTVHNDDGSFWLEARRNDTGAIVWRDQVGSGLTPRESPPRSTQKFHRLHNLASPSPVTDGKVVVAHFGNGDLAAYQIDGKQLWKRNLQKDYGDYSIWWGHANSPVIHGDLVISVCMQDSLEGVRNKPVNSYLVAHELQTGKVRWFTRRVTDANAEECDSYTTPLVVHRKDHDEIVVMGGNQLDGYAPKTGKQLWFLPRLKGGRTITGPTYAHDMIFTTIGMRGPLLGITPFGQQGQIDRDGIVWTSRTGTPDTCCPVVWRDLVFVVTDKGVARCYNVRNGKLEWTERLKGVYKASPVAVDGHILFLNTEGLCTVVIAISRFEETATNLIPDTTLASPAISNGRIYLRGHKFLWCIGRK